MGLSTFRYLGLFAFSASVLYVVYKLPFSLFTYHPLFILMMSLVLITEGTARLQNKKTTQNKNLHGLFQFVGYLFLVLGFSVIYYNKIVISRPHFHSVHAKLGSLTFWYKTIQVIVGSLTFWYMTIQVIVGSLLTYFPGLVGGKFRALKFYKYHRISGYIFLTLLWTTTYFGVTIPYLLVSPYLSYIYYFSFTVLAFALFPTRK